MTERSAVLGRVRVRGDDVELDMGEPPLIEVQRGDRLVLSVLYDFDDDPDVRETLRLRLDVTLDGRKEGTAEALVRDTPVRDDSHRGALSLTTRAPRQDGEGTFVLRVDNEVGAWGGKDEARREGRIAQGTFRVRVR